ncbi:hypothetical protein J6590_092956 [Homalodisca vitripennis]|nr:hypothetical protein J6590_092956 [Homalodisca vitripennis]
MNLSTLQVSLTILIVSVMFTEMVMFLSSAKEHPKFIDVYNTLERFATVYNWCHLKEPGHCHICHLLLVVSSSSDVTQATDETAPIICKLINRRLDPVLKRRLESFLLQLTAQNVAFSGRGFFQINRKIVTSLAVTVITNLRVLHPAVYGYHTEVPIKGKPCLVLVYGYHTEVPIKDKPCLVLGRYKYRESYTLQCTDITRRVLHPAVYGYHTEVPIKGKPCLVLGRYKYRESYTLQCTDITRRVLHPAVYGYHTEVPIKDKPCLVLGRYKYRESYTLQCTDITRRVLHPAVYGYHTEVPIKGKPCLVLGRYKYRESYTLQCTDITRRCLSKANRV